MFFFQKIFFIKIAILYLLVLDLGSLGPSTVTLIALLYVATCGGLVETVIVKVKLFPEKNEKKNY